VKQWCTEADWRSRRTPHARQVTTLSIRPTEQQERLPPLPGASFLNGGKLLEEVAYVTNAYVPLQLLYCKRVERETLCRHQQRDSPAWRLLFSGWKAYTGIEDGIIRNECVRNPTVVLPFYLGERGWQTSTYCRVITLARVRALLESSLKGSQAERRALCTYPSYYSRSLE